MYLQYYKNTHCITCVAMLGDWKCGPIGLISINCVLMNKEFKISKVFNEKKNEYTRILM